MASSAPPPAAPAAAKAKVSSDAPSSSSPLPTILGDCAVRLSHSTSYEPPLYLFPQLLPQVPQGTAPMMVWDAVAGAVDVGKSYWHMADASRWLSGGGGNGRTGSRAGSTGMKKGDASTETAGKKSAMTTLASLLSSNKLVALGLHPTVLESGGFSAASMMQELAALQTRAELTDEEAAVLMSNHFVNLLAWKKLREINTPALSLLPIRRWTEDAPHQADEPPAKTAGKKGSAAVATRKRARDAEEQEDADDQASHDASHATVTAKHDADILADLQASPDPWTAVINDPARAGSFVAGRETNVEARVALIRTLSSLYRKPYRQLCSSGVQTDMVLPPGVVNTTSPYADHRNVTGAQLSAEEDLGWTTTAACMQPCHLRAVCEEGDDGAKHTTTPSSYSSGQDSEASSAPFVVTIGAATATGASSEPQVVELTAGVTYFGKAAGPQRTASMGSVSVDVGLAAFATHPDYISDVHFALMLRPVYGVRLTHAEASTAEAEAADDAACDSDEHSTSTTTSLLHTKTPTSYQLFLVNYGQNGVRVVGRRWVLGEVLALQDGDELRVGADSVVVRVTARSSVVKKAASEVDAMKQDPGLTPVKRESVDE